MQKSSNFFNSGAFVLLMAAAVLLLPWLGETFFNSKGEPREAIVGMTILQQNQWLLPTNYGTDIPFKPPFLGWLIAAFAWLFNGGVVNEYISRLPSALAAIAMVMAGYYWVRKERGERFAILFGIVTLTVTEVFRSAVACRLDMVLTACMVCGIYLLYHIFEHPARLKWLQVIGVILLFSCAVMTKGPVGSFLPCFAFGVYLLLRHRNFWMALFSMLGIAIASLALPAWWCWEAYKIGGQPFLDLMWEENFGRLLGTMSYESHVKPFYYNFMTLAAGLLPWLLLLLMCLFCPKKVFRSSSGRRSAHGLLAIVVAVVVIGFYCIPESKRSVYLLPAYPFICYGLTNLMDTRELLRPLRVFTWFIAIVAFIVPIGGVVLSCHPLEQLPPMASIPWWGYAICAIPVIASLSWIISRHSDGARVAVMIWSLYLMYAAVFMPAFLNPQSDIYLLPQIQDAPAVLSYDSNGKLRLYTLNFYMQDNIRSIGSITEAENCQPGTVVIADADTDTSEWSRFDITPLTKRGCDYRRPLIIATLKP